MDGIEHLINSLDYMLNTKRKRHIVGGMLLSISALFSGMAFTVMTIRSPEEVGI